MSSVLSEQIALSLTRLLSVKATAAAVVLFFDYCLMFNLEVAHIWPSNWSLTKILYLLSRYSAFVDIPLAIYYLNPPEDLSPEICEGINITIAAILLLRTYALSGRSRSILTIFGGLYVLSVGGGAIAVWLFLRDMQCFGGCNVVGAKFLLVGLSIAVSLAYETALMGYTLWIWFKTFRHTPNALVSTLYRDGLTYYVFLCLGSVANFVIILLAPEELRLLLNTPFRVLHAVLSTRVVLHLRETEHNERNLAQVWVNVPQAQSVADLSHRSYNHDW
ncbi:hypothetical protein B0H16DRAFT_1473617 [Mycena metata]|uniref:DUF6533 domain-containing protein n=1 Tax=Mycena metata TaxID=1033252 RepID=A0AAD7HK81_9AGAR|nr:hypothetical protein B0H16DRAFT_1473617 [Mycena metata]